MVAYSNVSRTGLIAGSPAKAGSWAAALLPGMLRLVSPHIAALAGSANHHFRKAQPPSGCFAPEGITRPKPPITVPVPPFGPATGGATPKSSSFPYLL